MKASKHKYIDADYKTFKEGCKFHEITMELVGEPTVGTSKSSGRERTEYVVNVKATGDNPIVRPYNSDNGLRLVFQHFHDNNAIVLMHRQTAKGIDRTIYLDCWKRIELQTESRDKNYPSQPILVNIFGRALDALNKKAMQPKSGISIKEVLVPNGQMAANSQFALTDLFAQFLIDEGKIDNKKYQADKEARMNKARNNASTNQGRSIDTSSSKPEKAKEVDAVSEDAQETVEVEDVSEDTQLP